MINMRETCVFPFETYGLYSTALVYNFSAQGEMVIRLGQGSPTGQWRQRLINADCSQNTPLLYCWQDYPGTRINKVILAKGLCHLSYAAIGPSACNSVWSLRQWASDQMRKIEGYAYAGNAENVFPATDFKGNR